MQISPAIVKARSTMVRAGRSVEVSSARAAASAKGPPEPMAAASPSGSMTSPVPDSSRMRSLSATSSSASSFLSTRSVRQSLASSPAPRSRLPFVSFSLASSFSNSVMPSAAEPAKPAMILLSCRRRTLRAVPFTTVLPSVTCPSAPMTTEPPRRTARTVVERIRGVFMGNGLSGTGTGVGLVVDGHQVIDVDVSIPLSRLKAGMSQHLLDGAQIGPFAQQVRGEAVTKRVRRHLPYARGDLALRQQAAHGSGIQTAATRGHEQRAPMGGRPLGLGQPGGARAQVTVHGARCLATDGDHAVLATLALPALHLVGSDVVQIQIASLGDAQSGAVDHLQQRFVAQAQRLLGRLLRRRRAVQQAHHVG